MTAAPLTGEVKRKSDRFEIWLGEHRIDSVTTRLGAMTRLCEEAVNRQTQLVVFFQEGRGKEWLLFSKFGEVSPSTAPAPSTVVGRDPRTAQKRDLGSAPDAVENVQAWVQDQLIGTAPEGAARTKRSWFARMRR